MPPAAIAAIVGTFGIPAVIVLVVLILRWISAGRARRAAGATSGGISRPAAIALWVLVFALALGFVLYSVLTGGANFS